MAEMDSIALRELRNNISGVLRRVEAGESLEVTVNGRPVASLVPTQGGKPRTVATRQFLARLRQADSALADNLAEEFTQTTDDSEDPWQGGANS